MKLPHQQLLQIDRAKIESYLLNDKHCQGGAKARFFQQYGFTIGAWEELAEALREHARLYEVAAGRTTEFGRQHYIDGRLRTPDSRCPLIRAVWQVDVEDIAPRLITAYPKKRDSR